VSKNTVRGVFSVQMWRNRCMWVNSLQLWVLAVGADTTLNT